MRSSRSAIEPGGHAGTAQGMFEKAEITVRRSDENRHLVESDTATRFVQNATGDLHAFAAFTGCGKQFERTVARPRGRLQLRLEEIPAQGGKVVVTALVCLFPHGAETTQVCHRLPVTARHRG